MSALSIVLPWRHTVAHQLLPSLHGHQAHALADLSFAAARAGHCQAGKLAPHVPTTAQPASARRRVERLLNNPRLWPRLAQRELARSLMQFWTGQTILLLLDEEPQANGLRVLHLRVGYGHRALPVAAVCYRPGTPHRPLPQLVRSLLRQALGCLPASCTVVLLADRGLAWPLLVDWCQQHGWHYVLRLQGTTRVRFPDGSTRPIQELAPRPGKRWLGEAEVFKKAGWRGAQVVATWERGEKGPWLLLTDQQASLRHCRTYRKRMWVEESHRDDKSSGFQWEESQVRVPVRMLRLLLVLALGMLLAASVGTRVLKEGKRKQLDPHSKRRLSLIQLGLRWLRYALDHGLQDLVPLDRLYLYPS